MKGTGGNVRSASVAVLTTGLLVILSGCIRPPEPGDPLPGLTREEKARFETGREIFEREFTPETGLGPLFNSTSCGECHEDPKSGGTGDEIEIHATEFLVRSREGDPPGSAELTCDPLVSQGGPVVQQQVTPALKEALGIEAEPVPARATSTGRRTTPSILGFGLLAAVPDEAILALADPEDRDHDGVLGRPNRFSDGRLGRFGRKAFVPDLREFNDAAFLFEQGITSPAHPAEDAIGGQPVPPGVDPAPDPEITADDLARADDFVRFLAPPSRLPGGREARRGERVFREIGCAACHMPRLVTGTNTVRALSRRPVAAYTDLLLHDMGEKLADVCLGLATPSEFRTEPLMGLRLKSAFLHDGRAGTVEEAIRLHGGEGTGARDRFEALPETRRLSLLRFLKTL
ncbi:MAG TPA: di-heme oxidoredictase family protein [Candidatus Polarisedimenticolia bacterium]|jgi:CxxC motif-containing protein (DUF1111 family)|nr:di-heme oxidoredictase family protein [Candidatus Polarisedimenticolia bacterium]